MSCEVCKMSIGETMRFKDARCVYCDQTFYLPYTGKYIGWYDLDMHYFKIVSPLACPNCKAKLYNVYMSCDNGGMEDVTDVFAPVENRI